MKAGTLLIVDDNKSVLTSLELLLEDEFTRIEAVSNPNCITSILDVTVPDMVILDMNFSAGVNSGNEGLFWLQHILDKRPGTPVIMLTAYGDVELAVRALKHGATDFVLKPWDNNLLKEKISTTILASKAQNTSSKVSRRSEPTMVIGQSPSMLKLIKVVSKVAKTNANILITGENGTGKEMLAREIHRLSLRNQQDMMSIDMGAVSESLFESELFGYEQGAFTDAKEKRIGKFEAANGSTLFLDEIGNLPPHLQSKLLNVLQNREIIRLGSTRKIPVDIRLITATNRNLQEMVRNNLFREDLFYRINTIHIEIPPLRNRREDIPLFADFFLKKYTAQYKCSNLPLHPDALEKLQTYNWPGNIRELQHTIEKAVILAEKDIILATDLFVRPVKTHLLNETGTLDEIEQAAIENAIEQNNGNLTAAAEQLGISRQTMYNKLKRFNS